MKKYKFMPLREIEKREPMMEELEVSSVARGRGGFLPAYKRADGNPNRLSEEMMVKRNAFIARHKAQYDDNPTPRRELALNAWAYKPSRSAIRITPKTPKLRR